jgi:hypothetical protein
LDDDGHAISYKALARGTVVLSADGVKLGTVRRVEEEARANIFDGIVLDTPSGQRFLDAPEVARIAERAVTLTITVEEVAQLPEPVSGMAQRVKLSTTVRRTKRFGRSMRDRWDRR